MRNCRKFNFNFYTSHKGRSIFIYEPNCKFYILTLCKNIQHIVSEVYLLKNTCVYYFTIHKTCFIGMIALLVYTTRISYFRNDMSLIDIKHVSKDYKVCLITLSNSLSILLYLSLAVFFFKSRQMQSLFCFLTVNVKLKGLINLCCNHSYREWKIITSTHYYLC